MNYYIVTNIEKIPDGATFHYLSNEGKHLKCKKIGRRGFRWKPTPKITQYRYRPFDDNWDAVVCTKTAREMGII